MFLVCKNDLNKKKKRTLNYKTCFFFNRLCTDINLQQFQEEVALNGLPPTVSWLHISARVQVWNLYKLLLLQIRMSNNRHQEIQNKVCIFYTHTQKRKLPTKKRHVVFELFLESLWNVQKVLLKTSIRCYPVHTHTQNNAFSSYFFLFFFLGHFSFIYKFFHVPFFLVFLLFIYIFFKLSK